MTPVLLCVALAVLAQAEGAPIVAGIWFAAAALVLLVAPVADGPEAER
jgi:hypothetical protein